MNPLSASGQIKGAVTMGIGMALHEELLYDPRSGQPLTPGYYGHRVSTHMDAPEIEVIFVQSDDGYAAYGAKSIGEAGKIPAVPAIGNAIFNATGRQDERTAHPPRQIGRSIRMRTFSNSNPRDLKQAVSLASQAPVATASPSRSRAVAAICSAW